MHDLCQVCRQWCNRMLQESMPISGGKRTLVEAQGEWHRKCAGGVCDLRKSEISSLTDNRETSSPQIRWLDLLCLTAHSSSLQRRVNVKQRRSVFQTRHPCDERELRPPRMVRHRRRVLPLSVDQNEPKGREKTSAAWRLETHLLGPSPMTSWTSSPAGARVGQAY